MDFKEKAEKEEAVFRYFCWKYPDRDRLFYRFQLYVNI